MKDNHIKPIGETLQDKINLLQEELFKEKEKNKELEKMLNLKSHKIREIKLIQSLLGKK